MSSQAITENDLREILNGILPFDVYSQTTIYGSNNKRIGEVSIFGKLLILSCANDEGQIPTTGVSIGHSVTAQTIVPCGFYNGSADVSGFLRLETDGTIEVYQPGQGNKNATFVTCQAFAVLNV